MLPYKIGVDERRLHVLFTEIGLVASLLFIVVAFRIPLHLQDPADLVIPEAEAIVIEDIESTLQTAPPPPPAALPPPVEVADTEVIEEIILPSIELNVEEVIAPPAAPPPPPAPVAAVPPPEPDPPPEPEVFVVVEQMPELIGGLESIDIDYPDMARRAGIEGRVFLQFIVNEDGSVSDIEVTRGVSPGLDQAAIEAVTRARFNPGLQRGHPVKVRFSIPIIFRLSEA